MRKKISVFWFRRDLRLEDNAGLYHALRGPDPVLPVFIFDTHILEELEDKTDARVSFIHKQITALDRQLRELGSALQVYHSTPENVFRELLQTYELGAVYANRDYEPYATRREEVVSEILQQEQVPLKLYKDQVIFDRDEVLKEDGTPYTVFTPYSKKWRALLKDFHIKPYPTLKYKAHFYQGKTNQLPPLGSLGFTESTISIPPCEIDAERIGHYDRHRDIPGENATTRLGVHLRFGTLSIRVLAARALRLNDTFLTELIWREFFMMILWHYPRVIDTSFREAYDRIPWRNNEAEFKRWCQGQTGYPIVDAGMRELNETGFMHNRVRMIVASFLAKHLLVDWRWGEAYFAEKLLDYDLAANNGNWQWAAGCGCDAAPYFRIFNPTRQAEKFDRDERYVRRWVPEAGSETYPEPMVDHAAARDRCLAVYKKALQK